MKKLSLVLGTIILLVLILLSLLVALTTARAGVVQAQANVVQAKTDTVQSVTALVGQCLAGLMVVVALVGGMVMGYGLHAWQLRYGEIPSRTSARDRHKWLPGPNAAWGRLPDPAPESLSPSPPLYPARYPHLLTLADLEAVAEGEENFIGSAWGFSDV